MNERSNWLAIIHYCRIQTKHADAYFVGRRQDTRAAAVAKGYTSERKNSFFKRSMKNGK